MKKRLLILLGFLLYFTVAQAQETPQSEHKLFVGSGVESDEDLTSSTDGRPDINFQFQIGGALPFKGINASSDNANDVFAFGFPFGIIYLPPTFIDDKFEVSKGYFSNGVNITWQIGANQDKITRIDIYRRLLQDPQEGETESDVPFELIASVSPTTFEYVDARVDGGVLFEYQIRAVGVPIATGNLGKRTIHYMQGIGYRNPTANVSGGVTFDSGSPVEDVTVFAEPVGAENRTGYSLSLKEGTRFEGFSIDGITNIPADKFTLQAWLANYSNPYRVQTEEGQLLDIYYYTYTNNFQFTIFHSGIRERISIGGNFPTGELDAEGNDILKPISELATDEFVHTTLVFEAGKTIKVYINGREMNEEYETLTNDKVTFDRSATADGASVSNLNYTPPGNQNVVSTTFFNNTRAAHVDEYRWWNRVLSPEEIRRDYRRYLGGGENGLAIYLRMDEGAGEYLYDLSKVGFNQNKNDARIRNYSSSNRATFSNHRPTQKQLGIFGVTDKNGSYIISGIPYKGTGESFLITPSLGVHEFEPASQTLFLGTEEPVVNQVNFKDISSFEFKGRAIFNVQDVFEPVSTTEPTDLRDYGYNKYDLGGTIINKGEYYYEGGSINETTGFYEGGELKQYPVIGLEGANIYIDGNLVFDADNQPILTDSEGEFTISVPIGNHKIEVKKDGHTFELNGRFPETDTFSFFEDQTETQYFIDDTRVTLVGRVVGGKNEFEKPIGFGADGLFEVVSNEGETNEVTEIVSSKNNIGVAQIRFKGDINSNSLDKIITTNSETGEYKVNLIPLQYTILSSSGTNKGITIATNPSINTEFLDENEVLDLRSIPEPQKREFTAEDGEVYESEAFQYEKSFKYNADVTVFLIDQEFEKTFSIDGKEYDISNLAIPIYIQKEEYKMVFEVVQQYLNKDIDANNPVVTQEYFTEGNFSITNDLAADNSEKLNLIDNNTKYVYSFNAGLPNITHSDGFASSINIAYIISGKSPLPITNTETATFKPQGIIKGGRSSNGTTFVTSAPEYPEIILRDPPGSNSFASIEKGTTFVSKSTKTSTDVNSIGGGLFVSVGPDISFEQGLLFSVTTEIDIVNDTELNISKTTENTKENEVVTTYTFNQTISTSDEPEFVGAEGDLYIGSAKNIYYGIFDNMFITETEPKDKDGVTIPNIQVTAKDKDDNDKVLYVSSYKDFFVAEQPKKTFFTYSQDFITRENGLIDQLRALAADPSSQDQSSEFYTAQADAWERVVQENERAKYNAKNDRETVRNNVLNAVTNNFNAGLRTTLRGLVNDNFYANRSFDAGLGEFTNSLTSSTFISSSYETAIDISSDFRREIGAFVNGVGATINVETSTSSIDTESVTSESEVTNSISYTLKDNDRNNLLSVDIVNMFDGHGPIFITKGGTTSCPYEGEELSIFFNKNDYTNNPNAAGSGGAVLSEATNRVYAPEITVDRTLITNVPESESAIFNLRLKNVSETQSDLEFVLDVAASTLNGLSTNIDQNGVTILLPYNETVIFPFEVTKSSSSSVFTYENIRVFLASPCDVVKSESEDFVDVSVEFKKSCSNVSLSAPENNWIFNLNEAYAVDVNGNTTTNKLPITFTDFNTDFNGFEKITLQYRNANQANWTKLQSYYGSQALKNTAGDSDGIVIATSDTNFTFNWDVVGNNIPDGNYEFRVVTFCADNISNTSNISSGVINLTAPVVFGTPQPSDGILDVGEDVSVRFNEDIFQGTTTSINITGLKNQQDIDHSVSVYLDGSSKQLELPNQILKQNSSLTMQFWYKANSGTGNLVSQQGGFTIKIDENHLEFAIGGELISTKTVNQPINTSQYNFYSFVYQKRSSFTPAQLLIFENGVILEEVTLDSDLDINTNASIFIGDQNVVGNIHDIRLWSRSFTPAQATVAKDLTLTGRELNLNGYWKLDEGFGNIGLDVVNRKNAIINFDWDVFPKGTSYQFTNNEYLELDNVNSVQISNSEDITLSFWMKASQLKASTIFSNGKGNDDEIILTNGFRNKWAVNLKSDGNLELQAENITYPLTNTSIELEKWTHIAIVLKRGGTLKSFIDGEETTSVSAQNLGGLTGNKFVIGARLFEDVSNVETIDNEYEGLLDEIRLWNTARSIEQIKRDRYFEIDQNTAGLLLYTNFNQDNNNTTAGPAYFHADINQTIGTTFAILSGSAQTYSQDSPALKPQLKFTNIPYSTVINGDELIITPNLTDEEWSLFEGQIINFSVARLTDAHFNNQLSPVTWSALVDRQELEWFTQDQTKEIDTQKNVGDPYSFTMNVINIGGSNQPYTITGIPVWMQTDNASGNVPPNSTREVTFTVDTDLAMGNYNADLFLQTSSGYNDRLNFNLRALAAAPDWSVNPREFDYSINIIGQIQIDGTISRDKYTKVGAFVNNEQRGEALLTYDEVYDSYFVFLTAYSNVPFGETVTFKIWDAINGKSLIAAIDGETSVPFLKNQILGIKSSPKIFSGDVLTEQSIILSEGWTWVSFFVDDTRFSSIPGLFAGLSAFEEATIQNDIDNTYIERGSWKGTLNSLTSAEMYKIKLSEQYELKLSGNQVDETNINFKIYQGWNWLPFPIHKNVSLVEALAFYEPTDGDVIKDQFDFAIYDGSSGWTGTLDYLIADEGYMLRSGNGQDDFNYPDAQDTSAKTTQKQSVFTASKRDDSFRKYQHNMNIVAEIVADETYDVIAAVDKNGVVRGRSSIADVNGKRVSFLTLFSNDNEELQFVFQNSEGDIYTNKSLVFGPNQVLGTLKNPFQINLKALSTDSFDASSFAIYPNPFNDEIRIDFNNVTTTKTVELYSILGVLLEQQDVKGLKNTTIAANNLAIGVYTLRVTSKDGNTVIKKIIKE